MQWSSRNTNLQWLFLDLFFVPSFSIRLSSTSICYNHDKLCKLVLLELCCFHRPNSSYTSSATGGFHVQCSSEAHILLKICGKIKKSEMLLQLICRWGRNMQLQSKQNCLSSSMSMETHKSCWFIYHLSTNCYLQNLFDSKIVWNCCVLKFIQSVLYNVALHMTNLSNGDVILRSFTKQMRQNMAIILVRIFYPRSISRLE